MAITVKVPGPTANCPVRPPWPYKRASLIGQQSGMGAARKGARAARKRRR